MSILAALEAAFRMDFLQRCYKRQKDSLSRSFRTLYQNKGQHVLLGGYFFAVEIAFDCSPIYHFRFRASLQI